MGLTQAELAQLAGTSQPNVSDYESERVSPTVAVAERLLATVPGSARGRVCSSCHR
jgi:transcriptional regulator with XRE-family HTH domain